MSKWYIYENEQVLGPFEVKDLEDRITKSTLVCRAGQEEWTEAGEVEEFNSVFNTNETDLSVNKSNSRQPNKGEQTERDKPASQTDATGSTDTNQSEQTEIVPTLNKLAEICQHATNKELAREYGSFWDDYDRAEQRVIRNELLNRGIFEDVKETEEV